MLEIEVSDGIVVQARSSVHVNINEGSASSIN